MFELLKGFFDKFLGSAEKSKTGAAETSASEATANAFIGVKDIRGSILYTRTNEVFSFIKLQSVSMGLLSDSEKRTFIHTLTNELSSESKPFRLWAIPRPVDISVVLDEHMDLYNGCTVPEQKELLKKDISQLADFATSRKVIERQYFIIIWERYREEIEGDLLKRARDWVQKLGTCGVNAEVLSQEAIITLCNLYANPSYAHLEDAEYETTMPILANIQKE